MSELNPFDHVVLSQSQKDEITSLRLAFGTVYATLLTLPSSRERALAITKLEEAAMWANKGVAFGGAQT